MLVLQYVTLRIIVHSQESNSELPADTKKVSTPSITSWALKVYEYKECVSVLHYSGNAAG